MTTLAEARALLEQLRTFTGPLCEGWSALVEGQTCPRCRAQPGEPCVRPNGEEASRTHLPRVDKAHRIARRCPLHLHHELLLHEQGDPSPDCTPDAVIERLRASALYRWARERQLITDPGDRQ